MRLLFLARYLPTYFLSQLAMACDIRHILLPFSLTIYNMLNYRYESYANAGYMNDLRSSLSHAVDWASWPSITAWFGNLLITNKFIFGVTLVSWEFDTSCVLAFVDRSVMNRDQNANAYNLAWLWQEDITLEHTFLSHDGMLNICVWVARNSHANIIIHLLIHKQCTDSGRYAESWVVGSVSALFVGSVAVILWMDPHRLIC